MHSGARKAQLGSGRGQERGGSACLEDSHGDLEVRGRWFFRSRSVGELDDAVRSKRCTAPRAGDETSDSGGGSEGGCGGVQRRRQGSGGGQRAAVGRVKSSEVARREESVRCARRCGLSKNNARWEECGAGTSPCLVQYWVTLWPGRFACTRVRSICAGFSRDEGQDKERSRGPLGALVNGLARAGRMEGEQKKMSSVREARGRWTTETFYCSAAQVTWGRSVAQLQLAGSLGRAVEREQVPAWWLTMAARKPAVSIHGRDWLRRRLRAEPTLKHAIWSRWEPAAARRSWPRSLPRCLAASLASLAAFQFALGGPRVCAWSFLAQRTPDGPLQSPKRGSRLIRGRLRGVIRGAIQHLRFWHDSCDRRAVAALASSRRSPRASPAAPTAKPSACVWRLLTNRARDLHDHQARAAWTEPLFAALAARCLLPSSAPPAARELARTPPLHRWVRRVVEIAITADRSVHIREPSNTLSSSHMPNRPWVICARGGRTA
jgi:hypothetical protein